MSHPNLDPAPRAGAVLGSVRWLAADIRTNPDRHTREQLADVRTDALALALAAGLPDEHRLLAELAAERAAGAHQRVSALAGELSARIANWGVTASEALWRADRAAVYGSERSQP